MGRCVPARSGTFVPAGPGASWADRQGLYHDPLTHLPSNAHDRPSLPPQLPLLMIQHGAAAGHIPQPQLIAERRDRIRRAAQRAQS
jgi:hypothetical protein